MTHHFKYFFLSKVSSIFSVNFLVKITKTKLILPFYHTVSDHRLLHIDGLYVYKNTSAFKADLAFFCENFDPIHPNELAELALDNDSKPKFLITFDDGLRESISDICPILNEFGLKSIFFINSSFIDNKDILFRMEENLKQKGITDISEYLNQTKIYLFKSEIIELIKHGHFIGSHSCNHPLYSTLSLKDQLNETLDCLEELTLFDSLQKKKSYFFSFPFTDFGVKKEFFEKVGKSKFQPLITFGTAGIKNDVQANHYQRIAMEYNGKSAKEIIKTELLYKFIRQIFNYDTVTRN